MKKIILSIVTLIAFSEMSYAEEDIKSAEDYDLLTGIDNSSFYTGVGLGKTSIYNDFAAEEISANTLMLILGYQYNQYVAFEGRYTFGFDTQYDVGITDNASGDYNGDYTGWGLYVKPTYPIGAFNIYALLGYGGVQLASLEQGDAYESGFQWGLGVGYSFQNNIDVFIDYISLYSGTGFDYRAQNQDVNADAFVIGMSYKF